MTEAQINQLVEANKQLKAALETANQYADKLVEGIPYLPADLRNSQQTVLQLTVENDGLKKDLEDLTKKYNNLAAVAQKEYAAPPVKHPEVPMLQKLFSGIKNFYEGPSITEAMTESMRNNPPKPVASVEELINNADIAASDDLEDLRLQVKTLEREIAGQKKMIKSECEDWAIADTLLEKLGCNMWESDYYIGLEAGIQQLNDRWEAIVASKDKALADLNDKLINIIGPLIKVSKVMYEMGDPQEFPGPYKVESKPAGHGKWNLVDKHSNVLLSGVDASHLQAAADCMNALFAAAPYITSSVASDEKSASTLIGDIGGQGDNETKPCRRCKADRYE